MGNYIGPSPVINTSSAIGIHDIRNHFLYKKSSQWPRTPPVLTFLDTSLDEVGRTTYTFTNRTLPNPENSREFFILIRGGSSNTRTVSSVSLAGVTATLDSNQLAIGTGRYALAYVSIPTGTSGDLSVTWSGAVENLWVSLYRVSNRPAIAASTDFAYTNSGGATSISISTLTTPANGFSLMIANRVTTSGTGMASNVYTNDNIRTNTGPTLVLVSSSYNRFNTTESTPTQTYSWSNSFACAAVGWSFN